jgi:hypothetical protein
MEHKFLVIDEIIKICKKGKLRNQKSGNWYSHNSPLKIQQQ